MQRVDDSLEDPLEVLMRGERAAVVRVAIQKLPPKQRATLMLRVYQELPHEEIAKILGSSVGAVKANFFHALGNLRLGQRMRGRALRVNDRVFVLDLLPLERLLRSVGVKALAILARRVEQTAGHLGADVGVAQLERRGLDGERTAVFRDQVLVDPA